MLARVSSRIARLSARRRAAIVRLRHPPQNVSRQHPTL